jgi:adenine-specific DNA-methyltransferase
MRDTMRDTMRDPAPSGEPAGEAVSVPSDPSEPFAFTWPGKREAARLAELAVRAALIPAPEESVNYGATGNRFVEGDNLEALKLLLPEHAGRFDLIYIDPPYNTGNAFIFADRYADRYAAPRSRTTSQAPMSGRGPSGAAGPARRHARWLSLLYSRLLLARRLLCADGALCMSIGEREMHHARLLLDEVFGEADHRNTLAVRRYDKNLSRQFVTRGLPSLAVGFEYVLIYARGPAFTMRPVYRAASARRRTRGYWKGFWNAASRPTMRYPLLGVTPETGQWKWCAAVAHEAVANYAEYQAEHAAALSLEEHWERTGRSKRFVRRNPAGRGRNLGVEHWIPPSSGILRTSNWTDLLASESLAPLGLPFDNPKSVALLQNLLRLCSGPDALVLDFYAGSCSTAHAVLALNASEGARRRFVMVQNAEPTGHPEFPTIAAIGKERIRRAIARLDAERPASPTASQETSHGGAGYGFDVLRLVEPVGD